MKIRNLIMIAAGCLSFGLPPHAFAEGKKVSLGYAINLGKDRYVDQSLSGSFLASQQVRLDAQLLSTRFNDIDRSTGASLGVDWSFQKVHGLVGRVFASGGTLELKPRGIEFGYRFELSSLWQGENRLELTLTYHRTGYAAQSGLTAFAQNGVGLQALYSFTAPVDIGASLLVFSEPTLPRRFESSLKRVNAYLSQNPELLPEVSVFQLDVAYSPSTEDHLKLATASARTLSIDGPIRSLRLNYVRDLGDSWSVGCELSGTSPGGDQDTVGLLGFSVGYRF